ncbi:MerR family transcriptional regulator [Actinomadura atramentaria]|uniref:MerR family transcriptional regulator n=1 Tax=Actinomadura atramentaria TaxID=1990 RepID=UPI00036A8E3C|nr:MerR family transcriptional regulator [Actinomadura atramentaria]
MTMRISRLAERTGVPATTLRFYEDVGLLPAARTPSGYRVYDEDAVARLAFIRAGKRLGLPLEEIGELLAVWADGPCADVKADLRPRIEARLADAGRRAVELAEFTASLRAALAHLDALPDRTDRCDAACDVPPRNAPPPDAPARDAPVACSLGGADRAARADAWRAALDGAVRTAIDGGLRLTLPAPRAAAVAELAVAEQECCPFFDFTLRFDVPDMRLEVRTPAEGLPMLTELFDADPA